MVPAPGGGGDEGGEAQWCQPPEVEGTKAAWHNGASPRRWSGRGWRGTMVPAPGGGWLQGGDQGTVVPTPWEKDRANGSRQLVLFLSTISSISFRASALPADHPIERDAAHTKQMGEGSSVVSRQQPDPQIGSQSVRVGGRPRLSRSVKRPATRSPQRISGSSSQDWWYR